MVHSLTRLLYNNELLWIYRLVDLMSVNVSVSAS